MRYRRHTNLVTIGGASSLATPSYKLHTPLNYCYDPACKDRNIKEGDWFSYSEHQHQVWLMIN